ncbi:MAG: glycosyltransferase [Deltaproteobacteria bacterium]|nr:glycosyltransferase [Deltaproteobacteria bacterium]
MTPSVEARPLVVLEVDSAREWRGGQVQTHLLVEGLRSLGQCVHVAAPPDGALAARLQGDVLGLAGGPRLPLVLRTLVRRVRPDVVAAQTPRAHGACVLAGLHPVVHRRVDFAIGRGPASRWKYARARLYVAVSAAVARVLTAGGVDPDRIRVVPDGIRPLDPAPPDPALAGPGPLVGAAGALVAHKGHRVLVEAMARLPGVRCVLLGSGPQRPDLEARIRTLGLTGRVRLLGHRTDVVPVMAALDLLVHPSLEEGMGQVVGEAMSLGVPVLVTSAGGLPEVVGPTAHTVPPGDPEALAAAIRARLADPGDTRAARRRALEVFSVNRMVQQTLAVYREAAGRGGAP